MKTLLIVLLELFVGTALAASDPDSALIVPGSRLGAVRLGSNGAEVLKSLPKPYLVDSGMSQTRQVWRSRRPGGDYDTLFIHTVSNGAIDAKPAESADICIKVGAGSRLVGVSAFAPKELRQGRHVVSGFSTLKHDELLALSPDLVITFSDVQAGISAELIRDHCTVLATNQRSLREIGEAILLIGRAIGCPKEAEALLNDFKHGLEALRGSQARPRPRVYFEEWDDPLVSGIGWVTEAIELVGGQDIFSRPNAKASKSRPKPWRDLAPLTCWPTTPASAC